MINKTIIGILFILWWQSSLASDIICVAGKEFVIHKLARRAEASATFKVTLNVVDFKPRDIKIFETDSYRPIDIYEESTIVNINKMIFLKDTMNFTFLIKYIILPGRELSRDCAIVNSNNEVCLYFSSSREVSEDLRCILSGYHNVSYLIGYIPYKDGMHLPSEIFVERIFTGNRDTTIIRKNNNPDYVSTILEMSRTFSKNDFLKSDPQSIQYFICFYIRRYIPSCGCDKSY
jgi:hypothetical protein